MENETPSPNSRRNRDRDTILDVVLRPNTFVVVTFVSTLLFWLGGRLESRLEKAARIDTKIAPLIEQIRQLESEHHGATGHSVIVERLDDLEMEIERLKDTP